jgi:hypothetical protein
MRMHSIFDGKWMQVECLSDPDKLVLGRFVKSDPQKTGTGGSDIGECFLPSRRASLADAVAVYGAVHHGRTSVHIRDPGHRAAAATLRAAG